MPVAAGPRALWAVVGTIRCGDIQEGVVLFKIPRRLVFSLGPAGFGAFLQLIVFAATSRALGAEAFGVMSVVFATSILFSPLSTLGSDQTIVRTLSRETASFAQVWGHILNITMLAFPIAWIAAFAVAVFTVGGEVPVLILGAAIAGEMLTGRAVTVASATLVAKDRVVAASLVELSVVATRAVTALIVFGLMASDSLTLWLSAVALQALTVSVVIGVVLSLKFGMPHLAVIKKDLSFGLLMMINLFLQQAQTNLDKILLENLVPAGALGVYSAGTRLQLLGNLGNLWVARLYYPGYFKQALAGDDALRRYIKSCVPLTLAVGLMSMIFMTGLAFLLPYLVGDGFDGITQIALVIALVPPFTALQIPAADALTALDKQRLRTIIYAVALVTMVILLLMLVPLLGAIGAAWALVLTAVATMATLWATLWIMLRRRA